MITRYDAMFVYEMLLGLLVNAYFLNLPWTGWIFLILIGLTFEVATASSWTYSDEFKRSFFTIQGTDVSIAAAFSWAAVLVTCMAAGVTLAPILQVPHAQSLSIIAVVGIVGNVLETICLRWGMFTYNATWATRMIFLPEPLYVWGVPIAVRLGYFLIFGPLCVGCFQIFRS